MYLVYPYYTADTHARDVLMESMNTVYAIFITCDSCATNLTGSVGTAIYIYIYKYITSHI